MYSSARWGAVTTLVSLAVLVGCTSGPNPDPSDGKGGTQPSAVQQAEPASTDFPPPERWPAGVRVGDLTDRNLYGVAARDDTVVAVGSDRSANVTTPLIVTSVDGGRTWERAAVELTPDIAGVQYAHSVAAADGLFAAGGRSPDGRPAIWTSADGQDWAAVNLDDEVFTDQDRIEELRAFGGRLYAVGVNDRPTGNASQQVVLWTSSDGADWTRLDVTGELSPTLVGAPSVEDIAVSDEEIVVVGGVRDNNVKRQPDRIAIWRSTDGGSSFTADPVPLNLGGDYRAYPADVGVDGEQIMLAARGNGADSGTSWDGVVLQGSFGDRRWKQAANPRPFGTSRDDSISTIVRSDKGWLLAGDNGRADVVVAGGAKLDGLRKLPGDGLQGRSVQSVAGAATTSAGVVLVGSDEATGSENPAVWLVAHDSVRSIALDSATGRRQPTADVVRIVRDGSGYLAFGNVNAHAVVWSSTDGATWTAQALPTDPDGSSYVTDGLRTAEGALAIGVNVAPGRSAQVIAWRRGPRGWAQASSTVVKNRYISNVPQRLAANGKVVMASANHSYDGFGDIWPLDSSDDGRRWTPSAGQTLDTEAVDIKANGWTTKSERPFYKEFRARPNEPLRATDIEPVGNVFVMGGSRAFPDGRSRALVWRTRSFAVRGTQFHSWTAPVALPGPTGAFATSVTHLASIGRKLVAVGTFASSAGQSDSGWVSWLSSDGGRSWKVGSVAAKSEASVFDLVPVPGGVVALGAQGKEGGRDATAWFSSDGRAWQDVEMPAERTSGPGDQAAAAGLVDGGKLRVVLLDVPTAGGGYVVMTMPVPGR